MPNGYIFFEDEEVIENSKEMTDDFALMSILADQIVWRFVSLNEDINDSGEYDSLEALQLLKDLKMFIDGPPDIQNLMKIYKKLIRINSFKHSMINAKVILGGIEARDEFVKNWLPTLLPLKSENET